MEKSISGDVVCRTWSVGKFEIDLISNPQSDIYILPAIAIQRSSVYFYFLTYSVYITYG